MKNLKVLAAAILALFRATHEEPPKEPEIKISYIKFDGASAI